MVNAFQSLTTYSDVRVCLSRKILPLPHCITSFLGPLTLLLTHTSQTISITVSALHSYRAQVMLITHAAIRLSDFETLPARITNPIQPTAIGEEISVEPIEWTPALFILRDQFETRQVKLGRTLSSSRKIKLLTCKICSVQQYTVTSTYELSPSWQLQFPLPASVLAGGTNISQNLACMREYKCLPGGEHSN